MVQENKAVMQKVEGGYYLRLDDFPEIYFFGITDDIALETASSFLSSREIEDDDSGEE